MTDTTSPEFMALYGALFAAVKDPRNLSLTDLCGVLVERGVRVLEPAPAGQREALLRLIGDSAAWRFGAPDELADVILASDAWRNRHPKPTEGEPTDTQVRAALVAYWGGEKNTHLLGSMDGMRAALRAAWRVADQEGDR